MPSPQFQLAECIAEYFSEDARYWPITRPEAVPFSIHFLFEDEEAWYVSSLREAWSALLSPQYASENGGEPLTLAHSTERCDACVSFREAPHFETGDTGLSYELSFARSPEVYPGWFAFDAA